MNIEELKERLAAVEPGNQDEQHHGRALVMIVPYDVPDDERREYMDRVNAEHRAEGRRSTIWIYGCKPARGGGDD